MPSRLPRTDFGQAEEFEFGWRCNRQIWELGGAHVVVVPPPSSNSAIGRTVSRRMHFGELRSKRRSLFGPGAPRCASGDPVRLHLGGDVFQLRPAFGVLIGTDEVTDLERGCGVAHPSPAALGNLDQQWVKVR